MENYIEDSPYKDSPQLFSINVKVIPHTEQRYETSGDYWFEDGVLQVRISKLESAHYEFLVLMHELAEAYLIISKGIAIEDIDKFDKRFEEMRNLYPDIIGDDEPGDNMKAPYRVEHGIGSNIERWLGNALHVNMDKYNEVFKTLER